MDTDSDGIISYLKQEPVRNLNMIGFAENYGFHALKRVNHSVILRGESDRRWVYVSSPDPYELSFVAGAITRNDRCFAAVEDWMVPVLTRDREVVWMLTMMRLILHEDSVVPSEADGPLIEPLREEDARFIYDHSRTS